MKIPGVFVKFRYVLAAVTLAAAAVFAVLIPNVNINHDMTKYLPSDSSMKQGMNIMEAEFDDSDSYYVKVMFSGLDSEKIEAIRATLTAMQYVDSVDYVADSDDYNKDGYTLFIVNTLYNYGSQEEKALESSIESAFKDYTVQYRNGSSQYTELPMWILLTAFGLVMIVLFAMCGSWIEPVLFIVSIGAAILLNLGSNIMFDSVSSTTFSLAAILQLVLSIDYSIILTNRYKQEREHCDSPSEAMVKAIRGAFSSIAGSSLTTVVGLLALLFMSFGIGKDMGLVLTKGVVCSMITNFTLLPCLVIAADKLIKRTTKKKLTFRMNAVSSFSYRFRYVLTGVFAVLFIGSCFTQTLTGISYSLKSEDPVADVFPVTETTVVIYDNSDNDKVGDIADAIGKLDGVKSVNSYGSLSHKYTATELSEALSGLGVKVDASLLGIIFYDSTSEGKLPEVTLPEFISFIQDSVISNELFAGYIDDATAAAVKSAAAFTDAEALTTPLDAAGLAAMFGMEETQIQQLIMFYNLKNGGDTSNNKLSPRAMISFIKNDILSDETYAQLFDEQTKSHITLLDSMTEGVISGKKYGSGELAELFGSMNSGVDADSLSLLLMYYGSVSDASESKMSIEELFGFLTSDILNDSRFTAFIDDATRSAVTDAAGQIDDAVTQLKGKDHSRIIVTTDIDAESDKSSKFFKQLDGICVGFTGEYHYVGNAAMSYEMSATFGSELTLITLLTALAVYIVVALTFKSFGVPLLIVLLIQCGVYITITIAGIGGGSIYYLAMLIVECILMGATIDYGILFTSYYREARRTSDVKESLTYAYNGSVNTIMTSGLVMVIAAFLVGYCFSEPTVAQICRTLSLGALVAIILILFVLPGVIAASDRLVTRKKHRKD